MWAKDSEALLTRAIALAAEGKPVLLMKALVAASLFVHQDSEGATKSELYTILPGGLIEKRSVSVEIDEATGIVSSIEGFEIPDVLGPAFAKKYGRLALARSELRADAISEEDQALAAAALIDFYRAFGDKEQDRVQFATAKEQEARLSGDRAGELLVGVGSEAIGYRVDMDGRPWVHRVVRRSRSDFEKEARLHLQALADESTRRYVPALDPAYQSQLEAALADSNIRIQSLLVEFVDGKQAVDAVRDGWLTEEELGRLGEEMIRTFAGVGIDLYDTNSENFIVTRAEDGQLQLRVVDLGALSDVVAGADDTFRTNTLNENIASFRAELGNAVRLDTRVAALRGFSAVIFETAVDDLGVQIRSLRQLQRRTGEDTGAKRERLATLQEQYADAADRIRGTERSDLQGRSELRSDAVKEAYEQQVDTREYKLAYGGVRQVVDAAIDWLGIGAQRKAILDSVRVVWSESYGSSYAQRNGDKTYISLSMGKRSSSQEAQASDSAKYYSSIASEVGHTIHNSFGLIIEAGTIHRSVAEAYDTLVKTILRASLSEQGTSKDAPWRKALEWDALVGGSFVAFLNQLSEEEREKRRHDMFLDEEFLDAFFAYMQRTRPDLQGDLTEYLGAAAMDAHYGFHHFVGAFILYDLLEQYDGDLAKAARVLGRALEDKDSIDFTEVNQFIADLKSIPERHLSERRRQVAAWNLGRLFLEAYATLWHELVSFIRRAYAVLLIKSNIYFKRLERLRASIIRTGDLVEAGSNQGQKVWRDMAFAAGFHARQASRLAEHMKQLRALFETGTAAVAVVPRAVASVGDTVQEATRYRSQDEFAGKVEFGPINILSNVRLVVLSLKRSLDVQNFVSSPRSRASNLLDRILRWVDAGIRETQWFLRELRVKTTQLLEGTRARLVRFLERDASDLVIGETEVSAADIADETPFAPDRWWEELAAPLDPHRAVVHTLSLLEEIEGGMLSEVESATSAALAVFTPLRQSFIQNNDGFTDARIEFADSILQLLAQAFSGNLEGLFEARERVLRTARELSEDSFYLNYVDDHSRLAHRATGAVILGVIANLREQGLIRKSWQPQWLAGFIGPQAPEESVFALANWVRRESHSLFDDDSSEIERKERVQELAKIASSVIRELGDASNLSSTLSRAFLILSSVYAGADRTLAAVPLLPLKPSDAGRAAARSELRSVGDTLELDMVKLTALHGYFSNQEERPDTLTVLDLVRTRQLSKADLVDFADGLSEQEKAEFLLPDEPWEARRRMGAVLREFHNLMDLDLMFDLVGASYDILDADPDAKLLYLGRDAENLYDVAAISSEVLGEDYGDRIELFPGSKKFWVDYRQELKTAEPAAREALARRLTRFFAQSGITVDAILAGKKFYLIDSGFLGTVQFVAVELIEELFGREIAERTGLEAESVSRTIYDAFPIRLVGMEREPDEGARPLLEGRQSFGNESFDRNQAELRRLFPISYNFIRSFDADSVGSGSWDSQGLDGLVAHSLQRFPRWHLEYDQLKERPDGTLYVTASEVAEDHYNIDTMSGATHNPKLVNRVAALILQTEAARLVLEAQAAGNLRERIRGARSELRNTAAETEQIYQPLIGQFKDKTVELVEISPKTLLTFSADALPAGVSKSLKAQLAAFLGQQEGAPPAPGFALAESGVAGFISSLISGDFAGEAIEITPRQREERETPEDYIVPQGTEVHDRSEDPAVAHLEHDNFWDELSRDREVTSIVPRWALQKFRAVLKELNRTLHSDMDASGAVKQAALLQALASSKISTKTVSEIVREVSHLVGKLQSAEKRDERLGTIGIEIEVTEENSEEAYQSSLHVTRTLFYSLLGGKLDREATALIEFIVEPARSWETIREIVRLLGDLEFIPPGRPHNMHVNTLLPSAWDQIEKMKELLSLGHFAGVVGYTSIKRVEEFTSDGWNYIQVENTSIVPVSEKDKNDPRLLRQSRIEKRLADTTGVQGTHFAQAFAFLTGRLARTVYTVYQDKDSFGPTNLTEFDRAVIVILRKFVDSLEELKREHDEELRGLNIDNWIRRSNYADGKVLSVLIENPKFKGAVLESIKTLVAEVQEIAKQQEKLTAVRLTDQVKIEQVKADAMIRGMVRQIEGDDALADDLAKGLDDYFRIVQEERAKHRRKKAFDPWGGQGPPDFDAYRGWGANSLPDLGKLLLPLSLQIPDLVNYEILLLKRTRWQRFTDRLRGLWQGIQRFLRGTSFQDRYGHLESFYPKTISIPGEAELLTNTILTRRSAFIKALVDADYAKYVKKQGAKTRAVLLPGVKFETMIRVRVNEGEEVTDTIRNIDTYFKQRAPAGRSELRTDTVRIEPFGHKRNLYTDPLRADFQEILFSEIGRPEEINRPLEILDLGSHEGAFLPAIKSQLEAFGYEVNIVGVEASAELYRVAQERGHNVVGGVIEVDGTIEAYEIADQSKIPENHFDLVFINAPNLGNDAVYSRWLNAFLRYVRIKDDSGRGGIGVLRLHADPNQYAREHTDARDGAGAVSRDLSLDAGRRFEGETLERTFKFYNNIVRQEFDYQTSPEFARGAAPLGPAILLSPAQSGFNKLHTGEETAKGPRGELSTELSATDIPAVSIVPEADFDGQLPPERVTVGGVAYEFENDLGTQGIVYTRSRPDGQGREALKIFFKPRSGIAPHVELRHLEALKQINNELVARGLPVPFIREIVRVDEGDYEGFYGIIRDFEEGSLLEEHLREIDRTSEEGKRLIQQAEAVLGEIDDYTVRTYGYPMADRRGRIDPSSGSPDDYSNFTARGRLFDPLTITMIIAYVDGITEVFGRTYTPLREDRTRSERRSETQSVAHLVPDSSPVRDDVIRAYDALPAKFADFEVRTRQQFEAMEKQFAGWTGFGNVTNLAANIRQRGIEWVQKNHGIADIVQHVAELAASVPAGEPVRILDVGAGQGTFLEELSQALTQLDPELPKRIVLEGVDPGALSEDREQELLSHEITVRRGLGEYLPDDQFPDGKYHLVLATQVTQYAFDPFQLYRRVGRLLTANGRAYLSNLPTATYRIEGESHTVDFASLARGIVDPNNEVSQVLLTKNGVGELQQVIPQYRVTAIENPAEFEAYLTDITELSIPSDVVRILSPLRSQRRDVEGEPFNVYDLLSEELKVLRAEMNDPNSGVGQVIEKRKAGLQEYSAYLKSLNKQIVSKLFGDGADASKRVDRVYYPFGGFDPYIPFTVFPDAEDVYSMGIEGFGAYSDIKRFLTSKDNDWLRAGGKYSGYDSIRDLMGAAPGAIAISRILGHLGGNIESIHYFELVEGGTIRYATEDEIRPFPITVEYLMQTLGISESESQDLMTKLRGSREGAYDNYINDEGFATLQYERTLDPRQVFYGLPEDLRAKYGYGFRDKLVRALTKSLNKDKSDNVVITFKDPNTGAIKRYWYIQNNVSSGIVSQEQLGYLGRFWPQLVSAGLVDGGGVVQPKIIEEGKEVLNELGLDELHKQNLFNILSREYEEMAAYLAYIGTISFQAMLIKGANNMWSSEQEMEGLDPAAATSLVFQQTVNQAIRNEAFVVSDDRLEDSHRVHDGGEKYHPIWRGEPHRITLESSFGYNSAKENLWFGPSELLKRVGEVTDEPDRSELRESDAAAATGPSEVVDTLPVFLRGLSREQLLQIGLRIEQGLRIEEFRSTLQDTFNVNRGQFDRALSAFIEDVWADITVDATGKERSVEGVIERIFDADFESLLAERFAEHEIPFLKGRAGELVNRLRRVLALTLAGIRAALPNADVAGLAQFSERALWVLEQRNPELFNAAYQQVTGDTGAELLTRVHSKDHALVISAAYFAAEGTIARRERENGLRTIAARFRIPVGIPYIINTPQESLALGLAKLFGQVTAFGVRYGEAVDQKRIENQNIMFRGHAAYILTGEDSFNHDPRRAESSTRGVHAQTDFVGEEGVSFDNFVRLLDVVFQADLLYDQLQKTPGSILPSLNRVTFNAFVSFFNELADTDIVRKAFDAAA
ncbi:MAG: class I SAM-dependent methyltransferase [Candidatus Omnitrophota bacterium]|nr:class I SAM-dependent methyltransferase [Candidatus Omnitrophota bacterium]